MSENHGQIPRGTGQTSRATRQIPRRTQQIPHVTHQTPREIAHRDSAIRKATVRLIPFLCLAYTINFLDRVNVGFAALHMNADLGFSPSVLRLCQPAAAG